jgi:hypothetical protein
MRPPPPQFGFSPAHTIPALGDGRGRPSPPAAAMPKGRPAPRPSEQESNTGVLLFLVRSLFSQFGRRGRVPSGWRMRAVRRPPLAFPTTRVAHLGCTRQARR